MYRIIGIVALVGLVGVGAASALIVYNRGALTPEEVTSNFYGEWIKIKRTEDPIAKNLHQDSTYATNMLGTVLASQAEKASSTDPVLCGQGTPTGFRVVPSSMVVTSTSTRARVGVDVTYPSGQKAVEVFLVKDGSWWRIDEIDCPL